MFSYNNISILKETILNDTKQTYTHKILNNTCISVMNSKLNCYL